MTKRTKAKTSDYNETVAHSRFKQSIRKIKKVK
jgi:hypothetical protein